MKTLINNLFKLFGLKIVKLEYFLKSQMILKKYNFVRYLNEVNNKNSNEILKVAISSRSENSQDIMVLDQLNFKKNGFFVEFGAGDGKNFSNTYILEKQFNWSGILAEPCKSFHKKIISNRSCFIDFRAVFNKSNLNVKFVETKNKHFSKISNKIQSNNQNYSVITISLNDLLKEYNCPKEFDYLSIDTEGNEYEIIKNFDFQYYKPKIISIEHNFEIHKKKSIFDLLSQNGYINIFSQISDQDSWYILKQN